LVLVVFVFFARAMGLRSLNTPDGKPLG